MCVDTHFQDIDKLVLSGVHFWDVLCEVANLVCLGMPFQDVFWYIGRLVHSGMHFWDVFRYVGKLMCPRINFMDICRDIGRLVCSGMMLEGWCTPECTSRMFRMLASLCAPAHTSGAQADEEKCDIEAGPEAVLTVFYVILAQ